MSAWITNSLAVVALLMSGAALFYSRRATRASEQSAEAAARSTAVAERQEQRQLEDAEASAVTWSLIRAGTAALTLTNTGTATARDVRVVFPDAIRVAGQWAQDGTYVDAGAGITVPVSNRWGPEGQIEVYWRLRPGGPERSWTHALI